MTTTVPGFSSKTFLLLAFAVAASSIVGSATAATLGLDDEVYHRGRLGDVTGDNGPSIREQMHRRMKHRSVKAPTCPSKVSFSGSKSKSDRGDKCTAPIACGDVIDGETTLTSNLICPELFTGTALTLMGSGAVLNCNGFGILRTQGDYDSISDGTGLSLEGGATAVNCAVRGWNVGVTMNEGSNTLADSIIERNKIGVSNTVFRIFSVVFRFVFPPAPSVQSRETPGFSNSDMFPFLHRAPPSRSKSSHYKKATVRR